MANPSIFAMKTGDELPTVVDILEEVVKMAEIDHENTFLNRVSEIKLSQQIPPEGTELVCRTF